MKKLLIVGAGGLGRETYQWAMDIQKQEKRWEFIGYLDDDLQALDKYQQSDRIVGTVDSYVPQPDEELICAIGEPDTKYQLYQSLLAKGAVFTTIIHPTVLLPDAYDIGQDVIIGPGSIVSIDVTIGDCVVVNTLTVVGHDVIIEPGCIISDYCDIMGGVHLESQVFLGSGANILPGVTVGANARVGAGSVVLKKVKAKTSVFGNPARVIHSPKK